MLNVVVRCYQSIVTHELKCTLSDYGDDDIDDVNDLDDDDHYLEEKLVTINYWKIMTVMILKTNMVTMIPSLYHKLFC